MNPWEQLQFLIGNWSSPVSGEPGQGLSGSASFAYDLDKNIVVRRGRAEFAPAPGETQGLVHEDLLIIYRQAAETGLRAVNIDNEGHIIHYTLTFPETQPAVIFESEASPFSPRARLVYQGAADGSVEVEFSVAAPGGELLSHVKGRQTRDA